MDPDRHRLPIGTIPCSRLPIELTEAWDNSEGDPRNLRKPPRDVAWGERNADEMGHAAILYTFEDEKVG
jgi:hypothetical protein